MSESREPFFGGYESRKEFSASESQISSFGCNDSRKVRDEFIISEVDRSLKKYRQDMANQIQELKVCLLYKKSTLLKELEETEIELKRLEEIEKSIN